MTLQDQIGNQLLYFLRAQISYNTTFHQYMFNEKFLHEIDEDYLEKQIITIKLNIYQYIILSKDYTVEFRYWKDYIKKEMAEHYSYRLTSIAQINENRKRIYESSFNHAAPPVEDITFEQIRAADSFHDLRNNSDLIDFVISTGLATAIESDEILQDFKLLYILSKHRTATEELRYFIKNLMAEDKQLDLRLYAREQLAKLLLPKDSFDTNGIKCHTSMSKKTVARFFLTWMETGLLFFDEDNSANNRTQFQKFIEANFTYVGDKKSQTEISNLSKQFTEISWSQREEQKAYVDTLISELQKYRDAIKN